MKIIQLGRATTLTFYRRSPDDSVASIAVLASDDGGSLATPAATNDPTSVAMSSAAKALDITIQLASTVAPGRYVLRHNPATSGPDLEVEIIAISASHLAELKSPLPRAIPSGTLVKGIKVTSAAVTIAATEPAKSVQVIWTLADDSNYSEEYWLTKRQVQCPIQSADLASRWSALKEEQCPLWQRRSGVLWQPQIDQAWDELAGLMLENGMFLHHVRSVEMLKPVLWLILGHILLAMGLDPAGSENRDEQMRNYKKDTTAALYSLKRSQVWIDFDQVDKVTDENTRPRRFLTGHERRDWEDLR